jgi:uncharacterized protein YndB with AHSA1/START domain
MDLRENGGWVFDMIGPDGTVYPNHHVYTRITPQSRIAYRLLRGEDGPVHAECTADFRDLGQGATFVVLTMVMNTADDARNARDFGAVALGLQTLGKLARAAGEIAD